MQNIDPYQPLMAIRPGAAPLTMRLAVTQHVAGIVGGVPTGVTKLETYVLLSALPEELRRRIELAVQAMIAGG